MIFKKKKMAVFSLIMILLSLLFLGTRYFIEDRDNINIQLSTDGRNYDLMSLENEFLVPLGANQDKVYQYKLSNAAPNTLYIFSLEIEFNNTELQLEDLIAYMYTNNQDGENSKNILHNLPTVLGNTIQIQKIIKMDEKGEVENHLYLEVENADVDLKIKNITCERLEDDSNYRIISYDQSLEVVIYDEDIINNQLNNDDLERLLDSVTSIKDSLTSLSNNSYVNKSILIDCTQNLTVTGLAGDPIYINRGDIDSLLYSINSENQHNEIDKFNFYSIIAHEISHCIDMNVEDNSFKHYIFDREFFATIKQIYALEINNFRVGNEFLSNKPKLSNGVYNYEVLLNEIIDILGLKENPNNWQYIIETINYLELIENQSFSKFEYFKEFIKELSIQSGIDIKENFNDDEWNTLEMNFNR